MSNPEKKAEPPADRRKKVRFAISSKFPINAVLALPGENDGAWKDWPGTLVDLSATGAHIQVSMAAVAYPESQCRLKLSLGTFKIEVPGTVAHFVCSSRMAVGGAQLYFHDPASEKAYQRVLEPAMIGATLAPIETTQENSVRYKEEYVGKPSAKLTVWRTNREAEISGVDFRMNRYMAAAEREPGSDPAAKPALKFKLSATEEALNPAQEVEARLMFRLAACNLTPAVPADVRKFLQSLG